MSIHAFNAGCNIIAFQKENKRYGMCCAWSTMIGYEEIAMLIGCQSVTGNHISENDIVGVSALANEQYSIAKIFGEYHSDEFDKFEEISYKIDDGAILIDSAKTNMKCKVLRILHLEEAKEDYFVILRILSYSENPSKEFLSAYSDNL